MAARGMLEGEQALYLDVDNDGSVTQRDLIATLDAMMLEPEPAPPEFSADYDLRIHYNGTDYDIGDVGDIVNISQGSTFTLQIWVTDTSDVPSGFYQAFVDVGYDSSAVSIEDPTTDIVINTAGNWTPTTTDAPSNVAPEGGMDPLDDVHAEANVLKWMGSYYSAANYANPSDPRLLVSVEFVASNVTAGFDFEVLIRPLTEFEAGADPADQVVSYNTIDRAGDDAGENLVATWVQEDGAPSGNPRDLVRFTGDAVRVVINADPVAGANYDSYDIEEDYGNNPDNGDDETSDPPVLEIDGQLYYVLDVLANDRDSIPAPTGGDRSRFEITGWTQPTRGVITIADIEDLQDIPEFATTGITSHQVLLYQVPAGEASPPAETFVYTITDSGIANNTGVTSATVRIFINGANDAPLIADIDPYELGEGNSVTDNVFNYVTDEEGGDLTLVFDVPAAVADHFVYDETTGEFTYTAPNTPGLTETVTFTVTDEDGASSEGTLVFEVLLDSLIEGVVYFDANNNGAVDDNAHNNASPEMRIGGVTVELLNDLGEVVETTVTDAFGTYSFAQFDAGIYSVRIDDPAFTRKGITSVGSFTLSGNEISGIDVGVGGSGQYTGLNFGYRGRDYAYIGRNDFLASNTEHSILLAFSKDGGVATLEWYSVDEGWDRLVQIQPLYAFMDPVTKNAQIAFEVTVEGQTEPQFVVQAFSTSTPGYAVVGETNEGLIVRVNGAASTVLQNLDEVDAYFANL